ncbi:MAG: ABC transporter permease subunit, partial [Trebonia sp.]
GPALSLLTLILRRLLLAIPVLIGVSVVTFASLHLIPGNPAQTLLFGTDASPRQVAALTRQLGLDRPVAIQYLGYLGRVLHGNLGESYINQVPVATEIAQRLPSTIQLAAAALAVALVIGVPAGLAAGTRPGGWLDRAATSGAVLGVAIPYFWLALVLVLVFSVRLGLVPSLGTGGPDSLILPAIALGWGFAAMMTRLLRVAYRVRSRLFDRASSTLVAVRGMSFELAPGETLGCPFRTRCPRARDICAAQEPGLEPAGPADAVACFFPGPSGQREMISP